ncbi:MAG: hypothetical protein H6765_10800 [Candidatus Peribacteria bacterium]|nr:MAG: hypothetical protein H6765_10800 [Candidatus Peribacteria bacterium]
MKKLPLVLALPLLLAFTFTSIKDKISNLDWVLKYQSQIEIYEMPNIPFPKDFFDPEIEKILKDSFMCTPNLPLKVQAMALANEQVHYGYDWEGVAVGYGMLPVNGNYWEDVLLGRASLRKEAREYVFDKLISTPKMRASTYHWARPTMVAVYAAKPDTAQAIDLLAVWKGCLYLKDFNLTAEQNRLNANPEEFTYKDWLGRADHDAKMYSFWFRRIKSHHDTGVGFSQSNAAYWMKIAAKDMWESASPGALSLFGQWRDRYVTDKTWTGPSFRR